MILGDGLDSKVSEVFSSSIDSVFLIPGPAELVSPVWDILSLLLFLPLLLSQFSGPWLVEPGYGYGAR